MKSQIMEGPGEERIQGACRAMVSEYLSGKSGSERERGEAISAEAAGERCAGEIHLHFGFGDGGEALARARSAAREIGARVARELLERSGSGAD